MMYRRRLLTLVIVAMSLLSIGRVTAQNPVDSAVIHAQAVLAADSITIDPAKGEITYAPIPDYTKPEIKTVAGISITGAKNFDSYILKSLSGIEIDDVIEVPGNALTNAVNQYMKQGFFSNAKVMILAYQGDKVWLEIHLTQRPRIEKITYTGISKSQRTDIENRVGLTKGMQFSPNIADKTEQLIKKYYDEKGYRNMTLKIKESPAASGAEGYVDLNIHIEKSNKTKIDNIFFRGNKALSDMQLRGAMKKTNEVFSLTRGRWLSSIKELFSSSKMVDKDYQEDLENIIKKYQEYGYRDAEITHDSIVSSQKPNHINIYLDIAEGTRYHIKDIRFVGNTRYNGELLQKILGIKAGDVYNQKKLNDRLNMDDDAVGNLYYNNGYIFTSLDPVETNVQQDSVSLEIRINEGKQATINKIIIQGNNIVYDDVIRRELITKPGMLFSKEDLLNSLRLINQLGHFDGEKTRPNPMPNPDNGTVDIEYNLAPKSSDQLELSVGWSQTGLVGRVGVKFTNFSIRNLFRPSMYKGIIPQGDGQTLSISGQTNGKYYSQLSFSFTDPWFGGKRPNYFSVSAFLSHMSDIDNRYYQNTLNDLYSNPYYNPYYGGYGGGYGGYGMGYGGMGMGMSPYYNPYQSAGLYESSFDPDKSLSIIGGSIGYGRRLNWPDNWFQFYASLNYTRYILRNWTHNTFGNFHDGSANDLNAELRISRNSMDDPMYTRRGSEFMFSVAATLPYSLFDKKDYSNPGMTDRDRYSLIEYAKFKYSGKIFVPLANPTTVTKTPVLMAKMEGGIITSYNKFKRSPFGTYYMGGDMMAAGMGNYMNETIGLRGYKNGSIAGYNGDYAYSYMKIAMELRYPILFQGQTNIWAIAFVEAGNAWRNIKEYNPFDLRRSAGVGARITLPMVGLVGIDWAYGFDRPGSNESRGGSNIHFVLGRDL